MRGLFLILVGTLLTMGLDLLWFKGVVGTYYQSQLLHVAHLKNGNFTLLPLPALLAYLLLNLGIVVLILPKLNQAPVTAVLLWGGFYGLLIYGIYDATNLALFKAWHLKVALLDLGWGIVQCSILTTALWWLRRLAQLL